MKIYNKKNNICLALVFLIGLVFSESLFAVRQKCSCHQAASRAEELALKVDRAIDNLILALKRQGKSNKEIKLYLKTIYLIRFFRGVELQDLDDLVKEAERLGRKEIVNFFSRIKRDLYSEKSFFDDPANWLSVTASEIYEWMFKFKNSKIESSTSEKDLEELLDYCASLKLEEDSEE